MKLIRIGEINKEQPGVILLNGKKIDVSNYVTDYDENFFRNDGIQKLGDWLSKNQDSDRNPPHP